MASLKLSYPPRNGEEISADLTDWRPEWLIETTTQDNIAPPTTGTAGTRSPPAIGSGCVRLRKVVNIRGMTGLDVALPLKRR